MAAWLYVVVDRGQVAERVVVACAQMVDAVSARAAAHVAAVLIALEDGAATCWPVGGEPQASI